jgi:hypothetical protein
VCGRHIAKEIGGLPKKIVAEASDLELNSLEIFAYVQRFKGIN